MNARQIIDEAIDPKRILWQINQRSVAKLRLRRKSETDEWVVRVWIDGVHDEDKDYYTDDKGDAISTMTLMAQQLRALGCSVI